jgi:predicted ATP-binding protein involved in virulence
MEENELLKIQLLSFYVKNFQGIKNASFKVPQNTSWIFITGENGFGKTTILQALAIALYGKKDGKRILTEEDSKMNLTLINKTEEKEIILDNPHFVPFKNFACYGSSRLVKEGNDPEKNTITYNLFRQDGYLKDIEPSLILWYFRKAYKKRFQNVVKLFLSIMPHFQDIIVDTSSANGKILYVEKDKQNNKYDALPFENLASGYKSIIAMIGDMILRLSENQPEENDPKHLEGIVIIDEFDLHLHPKWQRKLPHLLSSAFPRVQFIVSTHSPIPLLGAPANSAFLKVVRNKKEGIKIENLDYISVRNLTPNTILTSPIFDFDELIPESHKPYEKLRTGVSFSEAEFNELVKKRLEESLSQE